MTLKTIDHCPASALEGALLDVWIVPERCPSEAYFQTHRIHGAAIYGDMDPINIPQMLAYIPWIHMDPMGDVPDVPLFYLLQGSNGFQHVPTNDMGEITRKS